MAKFECGINIKVIKVILRCVCVYTPSSSSDYPLFQEVLERVPDSGASRDSIVLLGMLLFRREGRIEEEIDRRMRPVAGELRALKQTVVVEREMSQLSIYLSISVPTVICGRELWVLTQRTRLWIQAVELNFLPRAAGLRLGDGVRCSDIQE